MTGGKARLFVVLIAGILAMPSMPVNGQSAKSLDDVEQRLRQGEADSKRLREETKSLAAEEVQLRALSVQAAQKAQTNEAEILSLEARLDRLRVREAEALETLADQRKRFSSLLMALQRIARYPPEALMAQPLSPNDTVRGAILLRSAVPEVERRAEALRRDVDALAAARLQIEARRSDLAEARQDLENQAIELASLAMRKADLRSTAKSAYEKSRERVARLADQAKSLKDLMDKLQDQRIRDAQEVARAAEARAEALAKEAQRKAAAAGAVAGIVSKALELKPTVDRQVASLLPPIGFTGESFVSKKGKLPFPAVGKVVNSFNKKSSSGVIHKGMNVQTARSATVVTPFEGKIVYAGPFRSYGRLLIIDHGEGYHTLLAGLARLDVATGTWVLAREPVGVMGSPDQGPPVLYVEIRKDGQPINPAPWLRARNGTEAQG